MKRNLFIGILILVFITGCSSPSEKEKPSGPSAPVITGHPQDAAYTVGDTSAPLTVVAGINGNGKLSYKWYSNDSDNNKNGKEITGWTAASYTPSTAVKSTTYYYAVVTNTLSGKSSSTVSKTALIIVSDIEPIGGSAVISGTYKIGEELSVITTGITGAEAPFMYQWRQDGENIPDATSRTYTIKSANVTKVISCVITHNAVPGSVTVDGEKVPYTINIVMRNEEPGDIVTAVPDTGHEDNEITIAFTVADIYHYNLLDFDGVMSHIDSADSKGSGTRIYIVNPADASEGVINIIATFEHTDLEPDSIAFTDDSPLIIETYGGGGLTNAIKAGHLGTGEITYSSGNETVATVDGSGNVTLLRAGTAIITAQKAADEVYSHASKSYTLTVAPKPVTITGLTVTSKTYDGTTVATPMGNTAVNGVINNDDVRARGGIAVFADKNAGTGVTASFIGWTLDGSDAGNYTLTEQPQNATADISPKAITVSSGAPSRTLIPFNSGDAQYGATATVSVSLNGIIAGDTETVNAGTNSYGISGSADIGAAGNLTITYNGTTVAQTNALSVPLTVTGKNYTVSGSPSVNNIFIIDGVTSARAIPVTQNNITAFTTYANTAAGSTRHYKLIQNVTLTPPAEGGSNWTAIGLHTNAFRGSFNGQLNTITNLTINNASADYQGMFGDIGNGGTVERVGLIGGSVIGNNSTGGIAGYTLIGATVQNCYFSGNISGYEYTGGIVGLNGGTVQNCYFTGNISYSDYGGGGIVGYNVGTIQNCYSTGNILNSTSGGGIVGVNEEGVTRNCYATGDVNASGYAGGIAGYHSPMLLNCVALNRNVTTRSGSASVGRITSSIYGEQYDNYARSTGMTLRYGSSGTIHTPAAADKVSHKKDGADITVPFTSSTWWTTAGRWSTYEGALPWNFTTIWEWNSTTNLPILRNMPQGEQNPVLPIAGMEWIPAGTFTMGSPTSEPYRSSDETQHQVTISKSFYMGKYEVTQEQYQAVTGFNPSYFTSNPAAGEIQSRRPVENVTWYDAVEFCNKLSERESLTPTYTITSRSPTSGYPITSATVTINWDANGYRLPTEAEWEYACRAGTTTAYYTGNTINDNTGWYYSNSNSRTHEVGLKPPNELGLHDMHGNVWEWCWDWYGTYASGAQTDPRGAASGNYRVRRGGGWDSGADYLRSASRYGNNPYSGGSSIGFRVLRP